MTAVAEATKVPIIQPGAWLAPGYEVVEHLSRGRSMDVYDSWSHERRCRVVAKTLRPDRVHHERARRRLLREGRLLRRLAHPHIVRAYETVPGPAPVVVLETLTGVTLASLLDESPDAWLPLDQLGFLGVQLCSAVGYLHRHGFLHLDLKPSNIVAQDGGAKVIDLSIARRPGPAGPGVGTDGYMAPEQALGGDLAPAADIWGIGVVLFEAATGHEPFEPEGSAPSASGRGVTGGTDDSKHDDRSTAERNPQIVRPAPSVRTFRRLSRPLAATIEGCLRRDPALRPGVDDLSRELQRLLGVDPKRPADAAGQPG